MERKVGVVPNVVIQGAWGPKEYGLLLTDQQSIFVLEKAAKVGAGAILGGAIGAAIAQAAAERKTVNYEAADTRHLAAGKGNIAIPHESIEHLMLKKSLGGYNLQVTYRLRSGKRTKVVAVLAPPPDYIKRRKRAGVKAKEAAREYAETTREVLEEALPPGVRTKTEWRM